MQKHVKVYMDYFGYGEQDVILCENCGQRASDVHHLVFRSHGGGNEIENLCAVCRTCHDSAHDLPEFNLRLMKIHLSKLDNRY